MYKLVIEDDEGRTTEVPIDQDRITIGRSPDNYILLDERNVSRHHARIDREDGQVFLQDCGSSYGIRLNGSRMSDRVMLHPGDFFLIGSFGLSLETMLGNEDEVDPLARTASPPPDCLVGKGPTSTEPPALERDTDETPFVDLSVGLQDGSELPAGQGGRVQPPSSQPPWKDPTGETPLLTPPAPPQISPLPTLPPMEVSGESPRLASGRAVRTTLLLLGIGLAVSLCLNVYLVATRPRLPPPPPPGPTAAELALRDDLTRARLLIDMRRWDAAIDLLSELLTRSPGETQADLLRHQAVSERRAEAALGRIRQRILAGDRAAATSLLAGIAPESVYRAEAEALAAQPVETLLAEAQELQRAGDLGGAFGRVNGVLRLDAENLDALRLRLQLLVAGKQLFREDVTRFAEGGQAAGPDTPPDGEEDESGSSTEPSAAGVVPEGAATAAAAGVQPQAPIAETAAAVAPLAAAAARPESGQGGPGAGLAAVAEALPAAPRAEQERPGLPPRPPVAAAPDAAAAVAEIAAPPPLPAPTVAPGGGATPIAMDRRPVALLHYNRARKLQRAHKTEEALAEYHKALQADPSFSGPYKKLGFLSSQLGEREKACQYLKTYLELNPEDPQSGKIKGTMKAQGCR